jgi:hypothetical protein
LNLHHQITSNSRQQIDDPTLTWTCTHCIKDAMIRQKFRGGVVQTGDTAEFGTRSGRFDLQEGNSLVTYEATTTHQASVFVTRFEQKSSCCCSPTPIHHRNDLLLDHQLTEMTCCSSLTYELTETTCC